MRHEMDLRFLASHEEKWQKFGMRVSFGGPFWGPQGAKNSNSNLNQNRGMVFSSPQSVLHRVLSGRQSGISSLAPQNPVAQKMYRLTQEIHPDLSRLGDTFYEAYSLGKIRAIRCVFDSAAMQDILDQREQWTGVSELVRAMYSRQDDLIACLSLWQKLQHGPRVRDFLGRLELESEYIDQILLEYGNEREISFGESVRHLFGQFFDESHIDQEGQEIWTPYVETLWQNHARLLSPGETLAKKLKILFGSLFDRS